METYTHYFAVFAERDERWKRSVCGQSTRFQTLEHSAEPTCARCQAWLTADRDGAAALEALWAREADREHARKEPHAQHQ